MDVKKAGMGGEAPFCQIKAVWRKLQGLQAKLNGDHGVGLDEAILLCCLSRRCNCQGDIARETGLSSTQASRLLSKLENKGLVERSIGQDDRRKMVFSLNKKGIAKLDEISPLGVDFLNQ